jgi:hypothetical protein
MDWGQCFVKEIQNEAFTLHPPYEYVGSEDGGLYQEISDADYNFLDKELETFYDKLTDPIVEEKLMFFLNSSRKEEQLPRKVDLHQTSKEDDAQSTNLDSDSNDQQNSINPERFLDFPVTSSTFPVFDFPKMMQWVIV